MATIIKAATVTHTDWQYPQSDKQLVSSASLAEATGLTSTGVSHQVLAPGRRASYPHAEADEDEWEYVLSGTPTVWLDGVATVLHPGDFVGFPKGTGVAHTVLNETTHEVTLLVGGERLAASRVHYPLNPERNAAIGARHWADAPSRTLGPHPGRAK